jgi:hypothetical protein
MVAKLAIANGEVVGKYYYDSPNGEKAALVVDGTLDEDGTFEFRAFPYTRGNTAHFITAKLTDGTIVGKMQYNKGDGYPSYDINLTEEVTTPTEK